MLLGILLAILMLVCVALIAVILLQRSEGGAFGMTSGGPGAFMTARGTGDFLTRTTEILVAVFFGLCLLMTIISGRERAASALVEKLKGLPTISAAQPVSAAPAMNQAPAAPLAAPTTAAPNFATPNNGSLNLLGNTPVGRQAPRTAPAAQPQAAKTARTPQRNAPAEPAAAASSAPPIIAPPPVALPPPPAAPANQ